MKKDGKIGIALDNLQLFDLWTRGYRIFTLALLFNSLKLSVTPIEVAAASTAAPSKCRVPQKLANSLQNCQNLKKVMFDRHALYV